MTMAKERKSVFGMPKQENSFGNFAIKAQAQSHSRTPIGFVDDGETVVLRDYDGTFSLFDRAMGTEKKSFPTAPRQSWGQTLLSADGKYVVTCTVQPPSVWDLDGNKVAVLEGHKEWVTVAASRRMGRKCLPAASITS